MDREIKAMGLLTLPVKSGESNERVCSAHSPDPCPGNGVSHSDVYLPTSMNCNQDNSPQVHL